MFLAYDWAVHYRKTNFNLYIRRPQGVMPKKILNFRANSFTNCADEWMFVPSQSENSKLFWFQDTNGDESYLHIFFKTEKITALYSWYYVLLFDNGREMEKLSRYSDSLWVGRSRGLNPGGSEIFRTRPNGPWIHPASYTVGTGFPWGKGTGAWR